MPQTNPPGEDFTHPVPSLVENLTAIRPDYARKLWLFTASLPPETHLHLIRRKRELFRQKGTIWRQEYPHREQEIELACLLLAMRELHIADKSLKHKDRRNHEAILEADRMISEMRQKRERKTKGKGKGSPSRAAIEQYAYVILGLREKGRSWRKIQEYLAKVTGKQISHVYIKRCVEELAGDMTPADLERAAADLPENCGPIA